MILCLTLFTMYARSVNVIIEPAAVINKSKSNRSEDKYLRTHQLW
jgi:hypothetical protein